MMHYANRYEKDAVKKTRRKANTQLQKPSNFMHIGHLVNNAVEKAKRLRTPNHCRTKRETNETAHSTRRFEVKHVLMGENYGD